MSYDPATTGEAPISWGQGPPSLDGSPTKPEPEVERSLGFRSMDIGTAAWLPDEPQALTKALLEDGRPFNGAFVPLVIHDPLLAERSFDAAEWAADLIRTEGGELLGITPFSESKGEAAILLSPRQWNHTAAMIERLEELCGRYRLQAQVSEVVAGQETRDDGGLDPQRPISYVLDAGSFLTDGFIPVRLISPERIEPESSQLADKLRGFFSNRT